MIRNKERARIVIPFSILIVFLIIIGTLDLIYGNGILGLFLYGVTLVALSGFSYGLNIFKGLGLVSRHKRENLPRSKGKPPFTFTINSDTEGAMYGKEKRFKEIQAKSSCNRINSRSA